MGAGSGMRGRERADGGGGRGDRVNGSQWNFFTRMDTNGLFPVWTSG